VEAKSVVPLITTRSLTVSECPEKFLSTIREDLFSNARNPFSPPHKI
jgi:hypothetical protein